MRSLILILLPLLAVVNAVPSLENTNKNSKVVDSISTPSNDECSYLVKNGAHSIEVGIIQKATKRLEKRKGGGRIGNGIGVGRGGSGVGGGRGLSSSRGAGGGLSNAGGRTTTGSGTPRAFGGYYYGGAGVPFTSGRRSPSGMLPLFLGLSAVSLFFAGAWLYSGINAYHYANNVQYQNTTSNTNQTLPVLCLCQEYSVCGCDENHEKAFIDSMVANATASPNGTVSRLADVNGTRTLVINGTLANGTTADGGTEEISAAEAMQGAGMLMLAVVVAAGVLLL